MSGAPFILAMDISKTCTGVCEGRAGEVPLFYSIRGNDLDNLAVMMRLGKWLIERTKLERPDWLFYEAPVNAAAFIGKYDEERGKVRMTTNPETTMALIEMTGTVKFVAGMKSIATRPANVQTVRSKFLGHGRPSDPKKRAMALCRALGWSPANHDEADAGAVWWWACMTVAPKFYQPVTPMMQQRVNSLFDQAHAAKTGAKARGG